jgi:hypothetical protein
MLLMEGAGADAITRQTGVDVAGATTTRTGGRAGEGATATVIVTTTNLER